MLLQNCFNALESKIKIKTTKENYKLIEEKFLNKVFLQQYLLWNSYANVVRIYKLVNFKTV